MMHVNDITNMIIGAAIEVHRTVGPGLLESVYQECLQREFLVRGIPFERERPIPLDYKGVHLDCGYRVDFLVADTVVVEVKSIDALASIHTAQLLTYLQSWRLEGGPANQLQCTRVEGWNSPQGTEPGGVTIETDKFVLSK